MSQKQIRTRFITVDLEIGTLPEQEDIHTAIAIGNAMIANLLDNVSEACQITITSISFTAIPLIDKSIPETATSIHGIIVYAGGADTETIRKGIETVHGNWETSRQFEQFMAASDNESNVIGLQVRYEYSH